MICTRCEKDLPQDKFVRCKRRGYRRVCRPCNAKDADRYRKKYPDRAKASANTYALKNRHKRRNYKLGIRYGMSTEKYDEMREKQGGLCMICQNKKKLFVDHSHDTNKVRGLLCNSCNVGLGNFRENADVLRRAAEYVS